MIAEPVRAPEQSGPDPRVEIRLSGSRDEQFEAFVANVGPYLLRVALLLSGENHAEDLVQATFERTYRSWDRARRNDPRAYARKVLVNLRIDRWRGIRSVPGGPPGADQWQADVDRLESDVLPVVEELEVSFYLLEPGPCRVLEYHRGDYRDGDPEECGDLVPFDAQARADFDAVTEAVERSDVAVERIFRYRDGISIRLDDFSWQYNWDYAYLPEVAPDVDSPPATTGLPGEEWMHIRGHWWFHRTHDD